MLYFTIILDGREKEVTWHCEGQPPRQYIAKCDIIDAFADGHELQYIQDALKIPASSYEKYGCTYSSALATLIWNTLK